MTWTLIGRENNPEHKDRISNEGFYFWFIQHGDKRLRAAFKYAFARMARERPDASPRRIMEVLCEDIFKYEQNMKHMAKGYGSKYTNTFLEETTEKILARREEIVTERLGSDWEEAERKAQERRASNRISRKSHTHVSIFKSKRN